MTEDQIERRVERLFDALDRRFMNSAMTQAEYDAAAADISAWADAQYGRRPNLRSDYNGEG